MRQQCDLEPAQTATSAWCVDMPATGGEDGSIDLDRIVWDPEYRDEVLENIRSEG